MTPTTDVLDIDLALSMIVFMDGTVLPITNRFDADGNDLDESDCSENVARVVAGPSPLGQWRVIEIMWASVKVN